MRKITSVFLAMLLALTCAACGQKPQEQPTQPTQTPPDSVTEEVTAEVADKNATYIQLSICEEDGTLVSLMAYDDGEGNAYVEYVGQEKKVSTFELSTLNDIAAEIENSDLKALDGANVYEESTASASMYVSYSDETFLAASYSGTIPQEFRDGYAQVETFVRELMKDVPVYVPRPLVEGDVDPDSLKEMEDILMISGAEPLDMFVISQVPMDDSFTAMMGLSKTDHIVSGTSCSPMMTSVAFSCMIAKVDDGENVAAVAEDFAANIQWNRWVCVSATDALIAAKDNQVVCLVTSGDLYTQLSDAIAKNGWTTVTTLNA